MNVTDPRDRYLADAVATATPARLVTMLYERLCRDLRMAISALEEGASAPGSKEQASAQLLHAQDIVIELRSALRPEVWSGGPALAELYTWMLTTLIRANVQKDATMVREVLSAAEGLAEAWVAAAAAVSQPSPRAVPLAAAV